MDDPRVDRRLAELFLRETVDERIDGRVPG